MELKCPCSYQGGKQRLAKEIVKEILKYSNNNTFFYDLCCGSGAISLELINQGISPTRIIAIDNGGFGYFWESIYNNTFDLEYFTKRINNLPSIDKIQEYLKQLSLQPINSNTLIYDYILLQAGAFGSKWIGIENGKWTNNTFRNYWLPTQNSNRKSPVNPMMPMPDTILERITKIVVSLNGLLHGIHGNIEDYINKINNTNNTIIYIDPPYKDTTGYNGLNIEDIVSKINHTVFVSEGYIMPNCTKYIKYGKRKKGNISGEKKKEEVLEILNIFEKE